VDVPLSIKLLPKGSTPTISNEAISLKQKLTSMLARRYNPDLKLLDLSSLGKDPEFVDTEMFATKSTQSKFFPAIMKVCDEMFTNPAQKREAVVSVTLGNNNLPDVSTVTTLSYTFPDLKNLDLSNNKLKTLDNLNAWRRRFKNLEHLVLEGNELPAIETLKEELVRWFPSLKVLNAIQVRTDEEVILAKQRNLGPPIQASNFRDEAQIGENFLKMFFPGYDTDRTTLASSYYDADSKFSLSINMSAPRGSDTQTAVIPWDSYIKKSRNLTRITTLPARVSRLLKGTQAITAAFTDLPITRHPNLEVETNKWCLECHSLPGLPDPTGQSPTGVGGLIIYAHGEFDELNTATGEILAKRSFDRTFVLGPGGGPGGVKIINDILVLRAYGGHEAWTPTAEILAAATAATTVKADGPVLPDGAGQPREGKSEGDLQKEMITIELCKATRMTWQYSVLCLEQTGWNLEAAGKAFEDVKVRLLAFSPNVA
jgi:Leucine-rich repeat (LRR) protein